MENSRLILAIFVSIVTMATVSSQLVSQGYFQIVETNPVNVSLIDIVNDVNDDKSCALHCLNTSQCTKFTYSTVRECRTYSHYKIFGEPEELDSSAAAYLLVSDDGVVTDDSLPYYRDCYEYKKHGHTASGVYFIRPKNTTRTVYCDDGWTYILRRFDGSVQFHDKTWNEYKAFLGEANGEYWAGLELIHELTDAMPNELQIQLTSFNAEPDKKAVYSHFKVDTEANNYKLTIGDFSKHSTLEDKMSIFDSVSFSSKDKDNDPSWTNVAQTRGSGWWWTGSGKVNLLGPYAGYNVNDQNTANSWYGFYGTNYRGLKAEVMKIRRVNTPEYPTVDVAGARWRLFWWFNSGTLWAASTHPDVLESAYGDCGPDDSMCLARLPAALQESSSEILAVDNNNPVNTYRWAFDSGNNVAHAAWLAFHNHQQTSSLANGNAWTPIVVTGGNPAQVQDSFSYRPEHGVVSMILDDDLCDCYSSLQMGHSMCGTSWGSSHGPENVFGVDYLNDPGCYPPSVTKSLKIYFKDADNCVGVTCPDGTSCRDGIDDYVCL